MIYSNLRIANLARQAEWNPGPDLGPAYAANELFGEAGEAANVIKKLERERLGIRGSRDTVAHLAEELADVVICVDLLAIASRLDPIDPMLVGNVSLVSLVQGGAKLGMAIGRVCYVVNAAGALGVEEALRCALEDVIHVVEIIAARENIDLDRAVADKFNATSHKVGLTTRLAA